MSKIGNAMDKVSKKSEGGGLPTHGIIIILTISAEEIASFFMFECPCDNSNSTYGFTYLFGPSLLFFIIGLGMQANYWRLITGLTKRKRIRLVFSTKIRVLVGISRSTYWILLPNDAVFRRVQTSV